jgi:hypothetical protein
VRTWDDIAVVVELVASRREAAGMVDLTDNRAPRQVALAGGLHELRDARGEWTSGGAPGSEGTGVTRHPAISWDRSGPNRLTARNNAYTLAKGTDGKWKLRDGHGKEIPHRGSLAAGKRAAEQHQAARGGPRVVSGRSRAARGG